MIIVVCTVYIAIADNPRACQICSTVPSGGNMYCRICMHDRAWLNSNSLLRLKQKNHDGEVAHRDREQTLNTIGRINTAPSKEKPQIRKETGVVAGILPNPWLSLSRFDPHDGTPPELLHFLGLGLIKYLLVILNR
jgi:hypothetical protein